MKIMILIPAYQPDQSFLKLTDQLMEKTEVFPETGILAIDDGSGPEFAGIFEEAARKGCRALAFPENRGKGAAIRMGISYINENEPDTDWVITADCDGQHRPEDIIRLMKEAEKYEGASAPLLLGTRDFSSSQVPGRSRFGNRISSLYFLLSTGKSCPDTQTGLRAIPARLFFLAMETSGDRYEYEMDFLMAAAKEAQLCCIPIETVYENGNRCSHFRPLADSFRIFRTPLRYAASSLLSACLDLGLFTALAAAGTAGSILAATITARLASGGLNFLLNRKWSFAPQGAEKGSAAGQGIRYGILFAGIMLSSWFFTTAFRNLPIPLTLVKALVDTDLAVAGYYLQQRWVFRREKEAPGSQEPALGGAA